jgi:hypothetical protein
VGSPLALRGVANVTPSLCGPLYVLPGPPRRRAAPRQDEYRMFADQAVAMIQVGMLLYSSRKVPVLVLPVTKALVPPMLLESERRLCHGRTPALRSVIHVDTPVLGTAHGCGTGRYATP